MKITRWKKAAIAAVCGAITFGSLAVFSACDDKDKINEITAGNTVSQFVPTDGSKPTDHTGMENLAYLNYRLQTADAYSVEAYGTVTAQIVISYTQEVWTYKDYKDGVMVVEDISTSSLVNTATQSCFVGEKVLMRSPASDNKKNWNGRETEWKTDDPAVYTKAAYERTYGLLCTEFSVYVLNENTIEEISAPQRNDDGTYSMTLTLDGDKAGQYYVRRMKTMGGLSDYPTFNGVTVTYTFNENWQVLSSHTEENYAFKMGMLSSEKTKAVTDQTYSYDENKVDISAYTDFFSSYEKVAASDEAQEEKEPTVTDYLAEAFAPVLAGPVCFDATVTYGGADVAGEIYVNAATLSDLKLRARLGNVRLWFEGGSIYSLVNGTYVSLPAESVAVFTGGEGFSADTFSLDSLLEQLTGGEFTASQTGAVLQSRLTLAGLELPVKFVFTRDGRKLGLESVALDGLNVGGESLCVSLSYAALSSAPAALTSEEKSSAVDLSGYLTAASDLLQKDAFDLSVCLNTAEISLSATATVFTDGAADGNFSLGYKNQTLSGAFALADGYFYADIARSEGKEPLRFSLALSSLSEVLSLAGVSAEATALPDISTLAKAALGLGQKSLFTDAVVTEDALTVVLDGDALAALLSLDTGFGEISLTFGTDGALSLSGAGLSLGLSGAEGVARPAIDGSGYVDLTPVVSQAEEIYALLEEKTLCFDLDCSFDFSGVTARVTLTGGIEWKDGFAFGAQGNIKVAGTSHEVAFGWENNLLTLVYGNAGFKVRTSGSELDELKAAFRQVFEKCSEYLSGVTLPDGESLASIASLGAFGALLGEDGLSLNALLDAIELSVSADPLTVLLVVCSDNALSLGFDGETVSLSASLNFGEVKGSVAATLSKGEGIPAEKEIDFVSTAQLKGFLNYALDVFALAEEEEIALDISMTVRDGDEAYREVGFVRYTVSGSIVLDKRHAYATEDGGTEESFAASLSLAVESTTDEKSYYFTAAIYQGWFFLSVSYYNDPATENYHPLFMKGNLREISAILGTVKRVAGYDMPFLDELLSSFGSLASGGETDELWRVSDMIGSLALSDDGLSLVLKGDTVFGVAGAGDLAFTLGRGEEGVLLKMENLVYRTSPLSSLDISVGLSVSAAEISDPALSAEYIDISSLNEVLDSVLGSFFAFGTDGDGNETMDLLDGYYFSGVVSGSFGSCSVDFDVSISLRRERGRLFLNASIADESHFAVNSGRYLSYLTIDLAAGTVCMQRIQYEYYSVIPLFTAYDTPKVTYRSMTLSQFGADYWNQIRYLTNMGDTLAGIIEGQLPSGGETAQGPLLDVGSYVKGYTYACDENGVKTYTLTLNGGNFSDALGDMNLTFTCDSEGRMRNIKGSVVVYVTLELDLDYENVTKAEGDYSLTFVSLADGWEKEGYTMTLLTGKTTDQNDTTGVAEYTSFLTLVGDEGTRVEIKYGQAMELPDLPDTENAKFMGWFTEPDGKGEKVESGTQDTGYGGKTLYAFYSEKVKITLTSDIPAEGMSGEGGVYTQVFDGTADVLPAPAAAEGYTFLGWMRQTQSGWALLSDGDILQDGETLKAAWAKASVTASASNMKKFFGKATLTVTSSECEIVGLEGATVTATYTYYFKKLTDAEEYTTTESKKTSDGTYVQSYKVTVVYTIGYEGRTVAQVSASCNG